MCISIHALREESDKKSYKDKTSGEEFQSTLSVRRATTHIFHILQFA